MVWQLPQRWTVDIDSAAAGGFGEVVPWVGSGVLSIVYLHQVEDFENQFLRRPFPGRGAGAVPNGGEAPGGTSWLCAIPCWTKSGCVSMSLTGCEVMSARPVGRCGCRSMGTGRK